MTDHFLSTPFFLTMAEVCWSTFHQYDQINIHYFAINHIILDSVLDLDTSIY